MTTLEEERPTSPAEWRAAGAAFEYRGHRIFYREAGSGPPLVCIHGFPTASWDWHRVWPWVSARFRVIAPDLIGFGFGFSDKPRDYDYSLFDQADLVTALCKSRGMGSAHILAHDYGDSVAQELLGRATERRVGALTVRSVCFLNGGLFPDATRPRPIQRLLLTPVAPLLVRLYNRRLFRRSFRPLFGPRTRPGDEELDRFWEVICYNRGLRIGHRLARYQEERRRYGERWIGALCTTKAPLRFIVGLADPVSGASMAERYRQAVPDPDVLLLENIGHYPQLEDPVAVVRELLAFIRPGSD